MKKIALGQTIGILANIGVIAGIVFLAFEIQQNNTLLEAEATQTLMGNRISLNTMLALDDELADVFVKAMTSGELSTVERFKLDYYYLAVLAAWEWEFLRYRQGLISEAELPVAGWQSSHDAWPRFKEFWGEVRLTRNQAFAEFYEENILNR